MLLGQLHQRRDPRSLPESAKPLVEYLLKILASIIEPLLKVLYHAILEVRPRSIIYSYNRYAYCEIYC